MTSKVVNEILRSIPENELKYIDEINELRGRIIIAKGRIDRASLMIPKNDFDDGVNWGFERALEILDEELNK